ncbi:MAG: proline--tRNA ligase, partial [Clostridia bacterium]|nr:proline--tRNA ligase [Clostridia bacterium]
DNNGLVLPPAIAPTQAIVIPVAQHKEGVIEAAEALTEQLKAAGIRAKLDASENSAGWKFAEYEMKGVPVRIEIGPRDIENGCCVVATRHNGEKEVLPLENIGEAVKAKLTEVRDGLFKRALENREKRTYDCKTTDEIKEVLEKNGDGFIRAMWCGSPECEKKVKELTGVSSRCIPFGIEPNGDKCVCCGKDADTLLYWGNAY